MRVIGWMLTLAGAIWATGNLALLLVAGAAFHWAPPHHDLITRAGAGAVFGTALEAWSNAVTIPLTLALVALGWITGSTWRNGRKPLTGMWLGLMVGIWAIHAVNHDIVVEANQLAAEMRGEATPQPSATGSTPPPQDAAAETAKSAREARFAALHVAATRWHSVETLIALGLLVGGSVLVLRRPGARPDPAVP
jgi:hypothetical protein